jgi:hypothetical protein
MANQLYDNFFLSNVIEDQFASHLDLQNFCIVDNSLEGQPGMIRKVNRYSATDGVEKVEMGEGNTKSIETRLTTVPYTITTAQGRFEYYDEEEMTDPTAILVGVRHIGTDMFNTVNKDIFTEFNKATLAVSGAYGFDIFADAVALLNIEGTDNDPQGIRAFAFVSPADIAGLRKALKDELKYVEAFARTGYVGTVAGVDLYAKKNAVAKTIVLGTREAVTVFNKKGVEIERVLLNNRSAEDANVRKNTIFGRKYYVAALTDATKAVKITIA